jgi:alpha-beta hydrolase superfamily lysophospholipase
MSTQVAHAAMIPLEFKFTSSDGLQVACYRWNSVGPTRGIIQIAHGIGEHAGRYAETIQFLIAAGLTVYANDHRGHGRTAPDSEHLGNFGAGGFDLLVEDMVRLSRIAKSDHPGVPFILLGHSMGSFAAQQYVLDRSREIDGLILSGSGVLDGLAPNTSFLNRGFEPARTPFDWLSRDTSVVDAFVNDPLCFAELQPASSTSFLSSAPRLADPTNLGRIRDDLSIYLFSGSEDPIGRQLEGVELLIHRYEKAGLYDVSHDFYRGGRHEMLNEINRGEVRERLLAWVSSVLEATGYAPRGSDYMGIH